MTGLRNLIIILQVFSLGSTSCIIIFQWQLSLSTEQSQMIGGNLTMLLIVLGVINHHQASKGNWRIWLASLPALIPPGYALINSITRHLVFGHLMVLALHYMVYFYIKKHKNTPKAVQTPDQESSS